MVAKGGFRLINNGNKNIEGKLIKESLSCNTKYSRS